MDPRFPGRMNSNEQSSRCPMIARVITRSVGMRGRTKQAGVAVVSNVSVKLEAATAWRVSSIWVAPEDVLAAPRPDRHEP